MPINNIASLTKTIRLFWLYQNLPRGDKNAKNLSQLMCIYYPKNPTDSSKRKNLENDLKKLYEVFYDLGYPEALCRNPSWDIDNISGRTPEYHINSDFRLDIINEETLFFWQMLTNYTSHYLPVELQNILQQKLKHIQAQQKRTFNHSPLGHWQQQLITLPSIVHAPKLNSTILATIHTALLSNRVLKINYCKKWQQQAEVRTIYPHGLVFIDNMMYLSAFNPTNDHIDDDVLLKQHRNFAVCRIQSANLIDTPIPDWVSRDALSLENLKQLGKLEPTDDMQIKLVLKVQRYACQHLYERPLSDDQIIIDIDEHWKKVTATVANSARLQDWLVSMSQLAVVLEPQHVRDTVYARLQEAMDLYQQTDDTKSY